MKHYQINNEQNFINLAIISDTHSYLDARILDVVERCDAVLHAGDIGDAQILNTLAEMGKTVIAVAGNNDLPQLWSAEQREIVQSLPQSVRITLPGGEIFAEHGHRLGGNPDHGALRDSHPNARIIVYGHTHKQVFDQHAEPWVLNPGAAGAIRTHGGPKCAVITADKDRWDIELFQFAEGQQQVA
ncbi:MAG TPA: metallophosphoesterase [Gammaproteobacteria bacterium]|nr:metallophosphoesterase [Gammaproteobacteria bacterium]